MEDFEHEWYQQSVKDILNTISLIKGRTVIDVICEDNHCFDDFYPYILNAEICFVIGHAIHFSIEFPLFWRLSQVPPHLHFLLYYVQIRPAVFLRIGRPELFEFLASTGLKAMLDD